MKLLILTAALLAAAHAWTALAVVCVPLALVVGYKAAIHRNGFSMIGTGRRRAFTGRW